MQNIKKPRIRLYVVRSFSMKFNDTFDFVRENWRVLLRFLSCFILPLSILQSANLNGFTFNVYHFNGNSSAAVNMMLSLMGVVCITIIAEIIISALVYGLMRTYENREKRLDGLEFSEFKPLLMRCLKRSAISFGVLFLFVVLLMLACVAFFIIHPAMLIFPLAFMVFSFVPCGLIVPVYIFEDNTTISEAISKSLRYGFNTWGGAVAIVLVIYFITNIVNGMISLPYTIMYSLYGIFVNDFDKTFTTIVESPWYMAIMYLLGVVNMYVSYMMSALLLIAYGYQYGHAAEKLDEVAIDRDIDRFDDAEFSQQISNRQPIEFEEIDNFERL